MDTACQGKDCKNSGFTLLEILTVIVIIGVLSAIAFPFLHNQRHKANNAAVVSDLRNAGMMVETQEGGFVGFLPEGFHATRGVTIKAVTPPPTVHETTSYQVESANSGNWTTYVAPLVAAVITEKVFTGASDSYNGLSYRRISVEVAVSTIIGQNFTAPLQQKGKKGDKYNVGFAMRHNYTGCRDVKIELKDSAGLVASNFLSQNVCFEKDKWKHFEFSGTVTGNEATSFNLATPGSMTLAQNFDITGANIARTTITTTSTIDNSKGFCLLGTHEDNEGKIWNYSSHSGGVSEGGCK